MLKLLLFLNAFNLCITEYIFILNLLFFVILLICFRCIRIQILNFINRIQISLPNWKFYLNIFNLKNSAFLHMRALHNRIINLIQVHRTIPIILTLLKQIQLQLAIFFRIVLKHMLKKSMKRVIFSQKAKINTLTIT